MPLYKTSRRALDRKKPLELTLELLSFSGGENTRGEDQELKANEARIIENWDAILLGGMIRSKGFNEEADGGGSYSEDIDLLIQHYESGSKRTYAVVEGDIVYENGAVLTQADNGAFTSGILCHAVSAGDKLWITNSTDNLKYKTIGVAVVTPADQPGVARDRIYHHKFRLIAEGGGRRVYGSRAASGNWTAADAWSLNNDAWNIDLPDDTQGCAISFPTGNEVTVFTKYKAYTIWNFPDVAYRPIPASHGCSAPYSIAKGNEGIFFVSEQPTLGVYLWDGSNWIDLTIKHTFPTEIDFANRIFGIYRDNQYYLFYNEANSGVSYPNKLRIYNTEFGRWMDRPVNSSVSDNFGYPTLLQYSNNELYVGSSQKDKIYELETTDNSDEGNDTEANYKTKDFTSADFGVGGQGFPVDEVRMKLLKTTITFYGTTGVATMQWTADRGLHSGSQTFDLSASGDLINDTFIVNTSSITTLPQDKTITQSFNNSAIGRRFNFQILNSDTGERPKIKKIKIHAIALEEY